MQSGPVTFCLTLHPCLTYTRPKCGAVPGGSSVVAGGYKGTALSKPFSKTWIKKSMSVCIIHTYNMRLKT